MTVCSLPGCPSRAVDRGRCARHRQTTTQRGYGAEHQARRDQLLLERPMCEVGCGRPARVRDHRVPHSMGGGEGRENERALCFDCHDRFGTKSSSSLVGAAL